MVKLRSETLEQRDYVDNLEHNDKRLTSKELSEILSDKEKVTIEYIESLGKKVKLDKRIAKILIEN
jgi:antitoxin component HigA of HigAB toxin-antitoxin module